MDIFEAIKKNDIATMHKILNTEIDINEVSHGTGGDRKWQALLVAAKCNNIEAIEVLLIHGAKPNITDSKMCFSPLYTACVEGNEKAAHMLLMNGADPSLICTQGNTALHVCAYYGFHKIIEILLLFNANINITNEEGQTALHMATNENEKECVEVLLKHGADVSIQNNKEKRPIDLANEKGNRDVIHLLSNHMRQNISVPQENATTFLNELEGTDEEKKLKKQIFDLRQKKISLAISRKRKCETDRMNELENQKTNALESKEQVKQMRKNLLELEEKLVQDCNNIHTIADDCRKVQNEIISLEKSKDLMQKTPAVDEEVYECPVCLDIPLPPKKVYQCSSGHLYCSDCKEKPDMDVCPQCKEDLRNLNIRSILMEQLISSYYT